MNFVKNVFVCIEMIICFSSSVLLMWYIILTDLQMLNHPCIHGINPTQSWCCCCCCSVAHSGPTLRPYGLQASRLLCLWNFPGKNMGAGCHFLLQGIFPSQGLNLRLLHLLHWQVDSLPLSHLGSPIFRDIDL